MTKLQYLTPALAFCISLILGSFGQLHANEQFEMQSFKGDQVIFGPVDANGIRNPVLIQSNDGLKMTILSLDENQLNQDISGCSRVVHSTFGKYQGIMLSEESQLCLDTFYNLSIYEGANLISELDWNIFISEESTSLIYQPLYITEKDQCIIAFSASNILSKYDFNGTKIFDYTLTGGSSYELISHHFLDERIIILTFVDHIVAIGPLGNLIWTRDGEFMSRVKYNTQTSSTYIYDRNINTGFIIGDNGGTKFSFSYPITEGIVTLSDDLILKGFKLIDLKMNKVIQRLPNLIDEDYREVKTFTASMNGEFLGSLGRRSRMSQSKHNYMIRVVSPTNTVITEYTFNFPVPVKYSNIAELQISNDGRFASLVYSDLDSNVYLLTFNLTK